jgi:hypothetical protein
MAKMVKKNSPDKAKKSEQHPVADISSATHQTEPRLAGDEA